MCAAFRVAADDDSLGAITRLPMRDLAQRVLFLDASRKQTRQRLDRTTAATAPELVTACRPRAKDEHKEHAFCDVPVQVRRTGREPTARTVPGKGGATQLRSEPRCRGPGPGRIDCSAWPERWVAAR